MTLRHNEARVGWASCWVLVLSYERGLYYSITHWDHSSTCWNDSAFDLQTDIIVGGNDGAKINKFLDCIKNIVIGRNLRINTPHVSTCRKHINVLPSFTARPIFVDSRSIALKAAVTSHLVRPMMSMSSANASKYTLFWKIVPLRLSQNILHDEVEAVALSETSHSIKRFEEVHSYLDRDAGIVQRHSA